jgi:pyruvate dehydrogenase E2 component (dihydrolipoamide acetyltransferase)
MTGDKMASEIVLPRLGWNMEEGIFLGWLKRDGETVKAGEPLFSIEGDKAAQEIESLDGGVLRIAAGAPKVGDTVAVGAVLGHIVGDGRSEKATVDTKTPDSVPPKLIEQPKTLIQTVTEATTPTERKAVTPRARRAALEREIELGTLTGTGRSGRIRESDVLAVSALRPVTSLRQAIARNMVRSRETTVPVTLTTTADATNLVALREQFKTRSGAVVPSFTDLFVKLAATALKAFPAMNSRWRDGQVEPLSDIHIGFAVATDAGLFVPVIRDVSSLDIHAIATRSRTLVEQARSRTLKTEEMQGGTFTVTNLGAFGIDAFTPVINYPECAILGLGAIRKVPMVVEDRVEIRSVITLSLTFDHRIVDGAPAAKFLQSIARLAEVAQYTSL